MQRLLRHFVPRNDTKKVSLDTNYLPSNLSPLRRFAILFAVKFSTAIITISMAAVANALVKSASSSAARYRCTERVRTLDFKTLPGRGTLGTAPAVKITAAVSPITLPMLRITAVRMPGTAQGRTTGR